MDTRPWHHRDAGALADLRHRLAESFPELHAAERGLTVVIAGWLPLAVEGRVIDRFRIEVELPRTYPKGLPIVREIDGRIPRDPNRHVEASGTACLSVPDQFWFEHPEGMDAIAFLQGPVLGYFVGQARVERGAAWPLERAHGWEGIVEYYRELLHIDDVHAIQEYLEVLSIKKLRLHVPCPCGSSRRLGNCHRAFVLALRSRIPRSVARDSLLRVKIGLREKSKATS